MERGAGVLEASVGRGDGAGLNRCWVWDWAMGIKMRNHRMCILAFSLDFCNVLGGGIGSEIFKLCFLCHFVSCWETLRIFLGLNVSMSIFTLDGYGYIKLQGSM